MAGKTQGDPDASWSNRRLRGYACGWCEQRLDRAKRGECGAMYRDDDFKCQWPGRLNSTSQGKAVEQP